MFEADTNLDIQEFNTFYKDISPDILHFSVVCSTFRVEKYFQL